MGARTPGGPRPPMGDGRPPRPPKNGGKPRPPKEVIFPIAGNPPRTDPPRTPNKGSGGPDKNNPEIFDKLLEGIKKTAGMLANENLAASMTPEEMVDGAINYYNLVQERLAYYRSNQVHSLEKMMDK